MPVESKRQPMPPEFMVRLYLNRVLVAIRYMERGDLDPGDVAEREVKTFIDQNRLGATTGGLLPGSVVKASVYEGGSDNPMAICSVEQQLNDNVFLVTYQLDGSPVSGGVSGTRGIRTELPADLVAEYAIRRMMRHYHRPGTYRVEVWMLDSDQPPVATATERVTEAMRVPKAINYARRP